MSDKQREILTAEQIIQRHKSKDYAFSEILNDAIYSADVMASNQGFMSCLFFEPLVTLEIDTKNKTVKVVDQN